MTRLIYGYGPWVEHIKRTQPALPERGSGETPADTESLHDTAASVDELCRHGPTDMENHLDQQHAS